MLADGRGTLEDLVAGVARGLLVTNLHYVNLSDPRDLVLTGTTRNGTFLIEGGRVRGAVRNLRFTESLVAALARAVAVGAGGEAATTFDEGVVVAPALAIPRFRFTSGDGG